MARSPLTKITFLGERRDIFSPAAAVPFAGHATEHRSSVRQRPDDDLSGHAHQVTRLDPAVTWCLQLCPAGQRSFLF
jgi:hypothetical protein